MKLNVWEKIAEELQHVTGCCVQGVGVDEHLVYADCLTRE